MIFSLDVCRARKGDCLLLHGGTKAKPSLVMIDGGPKAVYKPFLKPRLEQVRTARGLDARKGILPVDLLMISHVDDDHIQGILDLTRELLDGVPPPPLRVLRFWHNSFEDLVANPTAPLTAAVSSGFGPASLSGALPDDATVDSDEDETTIIGTLKVLASIEQGHRLQGDARKLGFKLSPTVIMASDKPQPIADGLTFIVAGPMKPELEALRKKHDAWVKEHKDKSSEAALAAYVDNSVPNLSSIVVHVKCQDKTILLTGDARGDNILEGLESVGLLKAGGKMHVDILKVPHHGSSNNLDDDFFERILADHYVFSGDGEHGNPERESMEMLFRARGEDPFTIHLTYPIDEIDQGRKEDWEKEQNKEKKKKANGGKKEVRENWSPAKHSLAAFFAKANLTPNQIISIVAEDKPHVIDLLDPLGF